MNWPLFLINAFAALILSILRFATLDTINKYKNTPIINFLCSFLYKYNLETAFICSVAIFLCTIAIFWYEPISKKKELIKSIVRRINTEIFDGYENERVTLFQEINYARALFKHIYAFLYHCICYPKKSNLYKGIFRTGRYLSIYTRCSLQFEKSTTMLRIENNFPEKCEGVAGYIRFKRMAVEITNLPDISGVTDDDFVKANSIRDIRKGVRRKVVEYMKGGYTRDFSLIKRIHRKARHFYGTIVPKESGGYWGVLLVDSINPTNPFSDEVKKKIDSFAVTLSEIINM